MKTVGDMIKKLGLLIAILPTMACSPPEEREGGPNTPPFRSPISAVIEGSVVTPEGRPLHNAEIAASVFRDSQHRGQCRRSVGVIGTRMGRTDSSGSFRVNSDFGRSPPFRACVDLRVVPPEGSELEPKVVQELLVQIGPESQADTRAVVEIMVDRSSSP